MKTKILILIIVVTIGAVSFSFLYVPAFLKCQSLEGNLQGFDTCVLQENKWMACYDFDPKENVCIIDGMKIKDAEKPQNNSSVEQEDLENFPPFSETNALRPEDRLQVSNSAGYTTVLITLSSWDEYYEWEKRRGIEHDAMPPIPIDEDNIDPTVFDLLYEMWQFENYEVSKFDKNLFAKKIQKNYMVPNHNGIKDWLKTEYANTFGESNDGYSSHFEFRDKVYYVSMIAAD